MYLKYFKLICAMILILSLFCTLAACGNSDKKPNEQDEPESIVESSSTTTKKTTSTSSKVETDVEDETDTEDKTYVKDKEEKSLSWFDRLTGDIFDLFGLNDERTADRTFGKIVEAIENKDKYKLKSVFSKTAIKESKTLDKDIEELFGFVKGNITSISSAEDTGVQSLTEHDHGEMKVTIFPCFTLETDEAKYYLGVEQCVEDEFDRDNEGVTYFCIINAEDWKEDCSYVPRYENVFGVIID